MFYKKILQHDYSAKLLFMLVLSCFSLYFAGSHFFKKYHVGKKTIHGRIVVFILGNVEFGNKGFMRYKFYMLFGKSKSGDILPDSNSYSLQHDEILVLRYSEVSKQLISSTH